MKKEKKKSMKFSLFSSTVSIYHFEPNTSIQIKKKKKEKNIGGELGRINN